MIKKNIFLILSFMLTVNTAMSMTEKNENIEIINLPNMETVELPVNVEKIIKPVVIENSVIKEDAQVTYIDGQTTINNINVPTKAMIINHENDKKITQIFFSIPDKWAMTKIIPELELFAVLPLKNLKLILSTENFLDKNLNIEYKSGANILAQLDLNGPMTPIAHLANYTINHTIVHGTFNKNSLYPQFKAKLPVKIEFGKNISTIEPILQLSSQGANNNFSLLSCTLNNKMLIDIPGSEKPIELESKLSLAPTCINVFGKIDGKMDNTFGVAGLSVYDWKLNGTINFDTLTPRQQYIPISDMALQCNVKFNNTKIELKSEIKSSDDQEKNTMFFEGKIERPLPLKDYAEFVEDIIKNNQEKNSTSVNFMEKIKNYLPNIKLNYAHIRFSPIKKEFANNWITQGLFIEGKANIFGTETEIMLDINNKGFNVYGYLQELDLGIIKITGPGPDHILGNEDDGLIIDSKLTLDEQEFYMGAHITLDIFGGIESDTVIDFSDKGISCSISRSLFGLFSSELKISAKLNEVGIPQNFYIKGKFEQSALTALQELLHKSSKKIALERKNRIGLTELGTQMNETFWYLLSGAVGNIFNIQEVTFEGKLEKLVNSTELSCVSIKGVVLGQEIELKDITFDLYDPVASAESLVLAVAELFE